MSEKIEYIELRIADILGRLKAMIVPCKPVDTLDELSKDPRLKKGTSLDGSSIVGLASVESSDLRLDPDPSSLVELPYTLQRTAAAMCFVREKTEPMNGKEFYHKDPRGRLHSVYDTLLKGTMELRVKIEPEFHFVTSDEEPFDDGEYADTYPANPGADILLEIATAIRKVGMKPRVIHHEVGEAQQEIEVDFDDSRRMADFILLFKHLARAVVQDHGIDITFMPKPFVGAAGSGLHCHLQLWEDNRNLFGIKDSNDLSDTAKMFVAGLLEHAPAITAIANPTVNSYKRLVPHHEAPVYISWGMKNRTALIRVPLVTTSERAAIELRSPDPMTNPYLLFTAIIAAGMDGIERKLSAPTPRSEDVFKLTDVERKELGISSLPSTLGDALDHLEQDSVIRSALGDELVETYIQIKRKEWADYISDAVTDWEWEKYFDI
ncbi:MAG: glutamine synthetase family protein [Candidatus Thorarchaeota archaeon]|jgi:glutamine synthetase